MRALIRALFTLLTALALAGRPASAAGVPSDERHAPKVGSLAQPALELPAPEPAQSAGAPKPDSVGNGIAIGALIGAGTGLALMGWAYAQCDKTCDAPEPVPMYLAAGGFGAAVGGVIGWLIDATRKNTSQRVSVAGGVAPKRSHVVVTLRW
jgi:hypothetical protein